MNDNFPACSRDFVDCAYPSCDCFSEVGGIITDDRVFLKCMEEAWNNPDADPAGTIGRFLRLIKERDATIARLEADLLVGPIDALYTVPPQNGEPT